MFENMTKDLTFIDPVCNQPGFHIVDVPQPTDMIDHRRIDTLAGPARPYDLFVCGSCGRHLLMDHKDAQRLTNPLNYQVRAGLPNGRFRTALDRLNMRLRATCAQPVSLPQQLIEDAAAGVDAFNLQPFPQPHAAHDTGIQEYMGFTVVAVDGMPQAMMVVPADLGPDAVPQLDDDLVTIAASLQMQVATLEKELELAKHGAQMRYDGMMNWKRTAEAKDLQISNALGELRALRAAINDDGLAATFQTLGQYRAFLLREPAAPAAAG